MGDSFESVRSERKRLKAEYRELYQSLTDILASHDPIGLILDGPNTDEYEPEAGTILPRLKEAKSSNDVLQIVYEEFVDWFGDDTAGEMTDYSHIAADMWHVWQGGKTRTDQSGG